MLTLDSEIVGVWSEDERFPSLAQSDEVVVFKPDGTGWIESWNFSLKELEIFDWKLASPGWVVINITKYIFLDAKTGNPVEIEPRKETMCLRYLVQEEDTPSGEWMKVLRMRLSEYGEGAFGFIVEEPESRFQRLIKDINAT